MFYFIFNLVVGLLEYIVFKILPGPLLILVFAAMLYLSGKFMKLQHKNFSYNVCVWTVLVSNILAVFFASIVNSFLSYVFGFSGIVYVSVMVYTIVFIVITLILLRKQLQANDLVRGVMVGSNFVLLLLCFLGFYFFIY